MLGLSDRIRRALILSARSQQPRQRLKFNKGIKEHECVIFANDSEFIPKRSKAEEQQESSTESPFFFRRPKPSEKWDRFATPNCSLVVRATALEDHHDENLEGLVELCLSIMNVIRGLSFIPGNERVLAKHIGLLRVIGRLLRLATEDDEDVSEQVAITNILDATIDSKEGCVSIKQDKSSNQPMVSDVVALFLLKSNDQKTFCPPEKDSPQRLLLEVANRLREDAFVILSHVSVQVRFQNLLCSISEKFSWTYSMWTATYHGQYSMHYCIGR